MHTCGNFIYKCAQWTMLYAQCVMFVSTYGSITLWNSGVTCFINIPEYCCWWTCRCTWAGTSRWIPKQMDLLRNLDDVHYGCPADGIADAHWLCYCLCYHSLWMPSRQTCWCTWTLLLLVLLFVMDAMQMDLLMCIDTVDSYCYCVLWMSQQMDMFLHMDIVNIIVIAVLLL